MRKYIANLTSHLIEKNGYVQTFAKWAQDDAKGFAYCVQCDLEARDVGEMNPGTLGSILCEFEPGDTGLSCKEDIVAHIDCASPKIMLYAIVSLFLADVIVRRLQGLVPGDSATWNRAVDEVRSKMYMDHMRTHHGFRFDASPSGFKLRKRKPSRS